MEEAGVRRDGRERKVIGRGIMRRQMRVEEEREGEVARRIEVGGGGKSEKRI